LCIVCVCVCVCLPRSIVEICQNSQNPIGLKIMMVMVVMVVIVGSRDRRVSAVSL